MKSYGNKYGEYYAKTFSAHLSKEQVRSIVDLLEHSNFPDFKQNENGMISSHCPSATLTIKYDHGMTKEIKDRCLEQNFTLMAIYNIVRRITWETN